MQVCRTQSRPPIAKEKVKAVLDIMDVAEVFSGQINTRPKQPLIICPFHNDKHSPVLGEARSCDMYMRDRGKKERGEGSIFARRPIPSVRRSAGAPGDLCRRQSVETDEILAVRQAPAAEAQKVI